jgi:hypothetical protein
VPAQVRYEYFAKTTGMVGPTAEAVQNMLNELGEDGWELVSVHALGPNLWPTFICKRPRRDDREDT